MRDLLTSCRIQQRTLNASSFIACIDHRSRSEQDEPSIGAVQLRSGISDKRDELKEVPLVVLDGDVLRTTRLHSIVGAYMSVKDADEMIRTKPNRNELDRLRLPCFTLLLVRKDLVQNGYSPGMSARYRVRKLPAILPFAVIPAETSIHHIQYASVSL